MCFIEKGIPVIVLETEQRFLDKGLNTIKSNWMRQVKKGKLSKKKYEKYISKSMLKPTLNYNDLRNVDIVIEAVFEKLSVKHDVFKKLDSVCKPECILASNTSFLPIEKIASVTSRPNKVIGTHFFAPANKMQLLENVRFDGGSDDITCATVQKMAKTIGKKGVLVKSCMGFVGNRMYRVEGIEAAKLLLEGCTPTQIDNVCYKDIGCAMGIMQVADLSGLDIGYKSRKDNGLLNKPSDYSPIDILVEKYGRLGLKVGKGYYDYPGLPKSRKPTKSQFVEDLIIKMSKERGIIRRKISKEEIIERLYYPFINEGFKILEEGIAIRPSDIDVVFVFGYGFPAYRGGPMHWAETQIGLKKLYKTLLKYYQRSNDSIKEHFKPSNLLKKCVESKMTLTKYLKKQSKKSKL